MKGFDGLPVSVWREYFTLGGCGGPESEYFSSGGCAGPEMPAWLLTLFSSSDITSFSECVFLGGVPPFLCLLGVPFLKNLPLPFPPPPPYCLNGLPPDGLLCLVVCVVRVYTRMRSLSLFYTSGSNGSSSHSCGTPSCGQGSLLGCGSSHICHMTSFSEKTWLKH